MNDVVSFAMTSWEGSAQHRVVREGLVALEANEVVIEGRTRRQVPRGERDAAHALAAHPADRALRQLGEGGSRD